MKKIDFRSFSKKFRNQLGLSMVPALLMGTLCAAAVAGVNSAILNARKGQKNNAGVLGRDRLFDSMSKEARNSQNIARSIADNILQFNPATGKFPDNMNTPLAMCLHQSGSNDCVRTIPLNASKYLRDEVAFDGLEDGFFLREFSWRRGTNQVFAGESSEAAIDKLARTYIATNGIWNLLPLSYTKFDLYASATFRTVIAGQNTSYTTDLKRCFNNELTTECPFAVNTYFAAVCEGNAATCDVASEIRILLEVGQNAAYQVKPGTQRIAHRVTPIDIPIRLGASDIMSNGVINCPVGKTFRGLNQYSLPICEQAVVVVLRTCPAGDALLGFTNDGEPTCRPMPIVPPRRDPMPFVRSENGNYDVVQRHERLHNCRLTHLEFNEDNDLTKCRASSYSTGTELYANGVDKDDGNHVVCGYACEEIPQ